MMIGTIGGREVGPSTCCLLSGSYSSFQTKSLSRARASGLRRSLYCSGAEKNEKLKEDLDIYE